MEVERKSAIELNAASGTLSRAIRMTLRTALVLSGCFVAAQSGFAETTNVPTQDTISVQAWEDVGLAGSPAADPAPEFSVTLAIECEQTPIGSGGVLNPSIGEEAAPHRVLYGGSSSSRRLGLATLYTSLQSTPLQRNEEELLAGRWTRNHAS